MGTLRGDIVNRTEKDCGTFHRLPKKYRPTHVVAAISYGAQAHIVFSQKVKIDYDKMDIEAFLKAEVDMKIKVPVDIKGSFELEYKDDFVDNLRNTTITMFSDFILEEQPTTVEETFKVFKDI